jgi:hypothetical protein
MGTQNRHIHTIVMVQTTDTTGHSVLCLMSYQTECHRSVTEEKPYLAI